MKERLNKILSKAGEFLKSRKNRRFLYLMLLCGIALGDFLHQGLARRTFVFYTIRGNDPVVEERFIHRSHDRETDIRRYVEQVLLGPKTADLALMFYRETQVRSLMYRDGVVFADLTEEAVFTPQYGGSVFHNLLTLNEGIRRNFSSVQDVRIFIGGNQVFFEEFREIFANLADNSKT